MDFIDVAAQMVTLPIPILVGYVAHKLGFMSEQSDGALSALVLNITLPCMIVASVSSVAEAPGLATILQLLGFSTAGYALAFALALAVPRLLGVEASLRGAYGFMVMFGNVGFIGYPVLSAIYGSEAIVYAAIANMPWNILVFSVGMVMVSGEMGSLREALAQCGRQLVSPMVLASVALLVLLLLGVTDLGVLGEGLEVAGDLSTPAALLITGSTIARYRPAEMLSNWRAYAVSAVRLLVVPALLLVVLGPFMENELVRGVIIVGQAMPMATNGALFCLKYDVDAKPVMQGTFISVVASVLTIPLVTMLVAL